MESYFKNKKVGIWGFGVVGKSVLSSISGFDCQISVTDRVEPDGAQKALIEGHGAQFVPYNLLPQFLEMNDIIIPSPGVNLKPFDLFEKKFLCELDMFAQQLKKPTIAVTGSVGKTTVVHVLTHLLNKLGKKALACGNIGFPLLDAVAQQNEYDILVVELSSFQLQYQTCFAPDIALITNIYPNHLDQHADMEEYLTAKGQLLQHQRPEQRAIIPMAFMDEFWPFIAQQKTEWLAPALYDDITKKLYDVTCHENWQLILATLEHLNLPIDNIATSCSDLKPLPDRIEKVGTFQGITFYNDSKSTIPEATLSAVQKFKNNPPILFLGGLSKGVNRSFLISQLKGLVKHIICFGAEAQQLHQACQAQAIESSHHPTLETAFSYCLEKAKAGDVVLFSPSGSSFDLFKNYIERGKQFTHLLLIYSTYL